MKYFKVCSRFAAIILIIIIIFAITGCTSSQATETTTPAAGIGNFNINMLDLNQEMPGIDVRVQAYTLDRNLYVDTFEQKLIYYLDVTPPTEAGHSVKTAAGSFLEPSLEGVYEYSVEWKDIPAGKHVFSAQLANYDYTPLNPPVTVQTTVTIPSEIMNQEPALQMIDLQFDYDFALNSVSVYDFRLNDDAIGKANIPGEGHFIYYLDVDPPTKQGQSALTAPDTYKVSASSIPWKNMQPGVHTFSVQLVNNDNTPLSPAVISQTTVELMPLPVP